MNFITLSVLIVIYLASLAYGMDCPTESHGILQSTKSCPRSGLDSSDKAFCCLDLQTHTTSCCDSFEWVIQNTKNSVDQLAGATGGATKFQQTNNMIFYLCFAYFIIRKL